MDSSSDPDISNTVKVAAGGTVIGAWLASVYLLFKDWRLVLIMAVGILVLLLLLWLLVASRKWMSRMKGKRLASGMPTDSTGTVRRPDQLAQVDAMRREFNKGLTEWIKSGRDLYSIPWYLMVGESGSGKTEAIRHSQIRFFREVHDPLQGVGGTLNMHWWFTRDAIILDTAGKKFIPELESGNNPEWDTFLSLLRSHRPYCPINGLLLVIPADKLMEDTSDEIDRKAGRIANQFERLQRALGVRFPVFVLITKCDKISGFNEFFDSLTDPIQQNQMMGWSNPASLDAEFDPQQVEEHFKQVRHRLLKRRMRLLLEPTAVGSGSRLDQMDALYALPDNLMRLAPRLKQYLDTIFCAGAWSQRPLFLRGIYFSCAMQQGSPLDPDLAAALGIPVAKLPKDREWDRPRPYFLKDVFMDKVFPEKGLVTHVVNVGSMRRRRRTMGLAFGFAAFLILGAFTVWGYLKLQAGIGTHRDFYTKLNQELYRDPGPQLEIVKTDGSRKYRGAEKIAADEELALVDTLAKSQRLAGQKIDISPVFAIAGVFKSTLDQQVRDTHRALVERSVVYPVVRSARREMINGDGWSGDATRALLALVQIEAHQDVRPFRAPTDVDPDLTALLNFAIVGTRPTSGPATAPAALAAISEPDLKKLKSIFAWTYQPLASFGGGAVWPSDALGADAQTSPSAIDRGIDRFIAWSRRHEKNIKENLALFSLTEQRFIQFRKDEDKLFALLRPLPGEDEKTFLLRVEPKTSVAYRQRVKEYRDSLGALHATEAGVVDVLARIGCNLDNALPALCGRGITGVVESIRLDLAALITGLDRIPKGCKAADRIRERIDVAAKGAEDLAKSADFTVLQTRLTDIHEVFLVPAAGLGERLVPRYKAHLQFFDFADDSLWAAENPPEIDFLKLNDAVTEWTARFNATKEKIARGIQPEIDKERKEAETRSAADRSLTLDDRQRFAQVRNVADFVLFKLAQPREAQQLVAWVIQGQRMDPLSPPAATQPSRTAWVVSRPPSKPADSHLTRTPTRWLEYIKTNAGNDPKLVRLDVPLTVMGDVSIDQGKFDARFSPTAVANLTESWKAVAEVIKNTSMIGRDDVQKAFKDSQDGWNEYLRQYRTYWGQTIFEDYLVFDNFRNWADFQKRMNNLTRGRVRIALKDLGVRATEALRAAGDSDATPLHHDPENLPSILADLKLLEERAFQDVYDDVCKHWCDMGDNASNARTKLLKTDAQKFQPDYTLTGCFEAKGEGAARSNFTFDQSGFLARYFNQIPAVGLKVLASEAQPLVADLVKELLSLKRFPLYPPDQLQRDQKELTPEEVQRAVKIMEMISRDSMSSGSLGREDPKGASQTIQKLFNAIRGDIPQLKEAETWIADVRPFAKGLAAKEKHYCEVSFIASTTNPMPMDQMVVLQGNKKIAKIFLGNSTKFDEDIVIPGDPIVFRLGDRLDEQQEAIKADIDFKEKLWSGVRLLYEPSRVNKGEFWEVTLQPKSRDPNFKCPPLTLKLRFKDGLLNPKDLGQTDEVIKGGDRR